MRRELVWLIAVVVLVALVARLAMSPRAGTTSTADTPSPGTQQRTLDRQMAVNVYGIELWMNQEDVVKKVGPGQPSEILDPNEHGERRLYPGSMVPVFPIVALSFDRNSRVVQIEGNEVEQNGHVVFDRTTTVADFEAAGGQLGHSGIKGAVLSFYLLPGKGYTIEVGPYNPKPPMKIATPFIISVTPPSP